MMKRPICLYIFVFLLIPFVIHASVYPEQGITIQDGLNMIQTLNDQRNILVSKELAIGTVERVYYVASDQTGNAFCILSKHSDGFWGRDVETYRLLPKDIAETPYIAYDNEQRVYITYYPDNKENTSIFLYGFTLFFDSIDWYVESVSYGDFDDATQVFRAAVINLATHTTSSYTFDQTTEQILNSEETSNHLKMLKVSEFSLEEFNQSVDLIKAGYLPI